MDLWNSFHNFVNEYEDTETGKWFLMASPFQPLILSGIYLYIIKVVLPLYMRHRRPFQFPKLLMVYNIMQVLLNVWLFFGIFPAGLNSTKCYHDDGEYRQLPSPKQTKLYNYLFHLSKYTDFIDTVLFILRKKFSQVTLLHVYHHSSMPMWTWLSVKYNPAGRLTFHAFMNSFVHIVMYTYYLLSSMGPRVRPYLWWKKYITMVQMVQFVFVILHTIQTTIYGCNVSRFLALFVGSQAAVYLVLFCDFYKKAYKKKSTTKELVGDCQEVGSNIDKKYR